MVSVLKQWNVASATVLPVVATVKVCEGHTMGGWLRLQFYVLSSHPIYSFVTVMVLVLYCLYWL